MPQAYEFGGFRFEPSDLRLVYQTRVIGLTAKAAETLLVLIQHPDTVVSKDDLMAAVWPDIVVEENNLNQQISSLRKALAQDGGPELIETVPRRGYRFLGPVRALDSAPPPAPVVVTPPAVAASAPMHEAVTPAAETRTNEPRARFRSVGVAVGVLVLTAATFFGWEQLQERRLGRDADAAVARASELMRQGNPRGATAELQQAITLDPANAKAYATLAHALANLASAERSSAVRPAGQSPSVVAARKSVDLDPRCADCHGTLGFFLFYHDWQWAQAEARYHEAIRLGPEMEGIRASYAMLLSAIGRQAQALEEIDFALRKRPYMVSWLVIRASILYLDRRYTEAIAAADQTLTLANRERGAWEWRSKALFQLGRGEEAVNALAQDVFADRTADLDKAVREGGTEGGLRKLLEITDDWRGRVEHSWRRGPWRALLNDTEGALEEVERAYEARRLNAIYLGVDPVYDKVRDHPRFQKVLAGMGLTDLVGKVPLSDPR